MMQKRFTVLVVATTGATAAALVVAMVVVRVETTALVAALGGVVDGRSASAHEDGVGSTGRKR